MLSRSAEREEYIYVAVSTTDDDEDEEENNEEEEKKKKKSVYSKSNTSRLHMVGYCMQKAFLQMCIVFLPLIPTAIIITIVSLHPEYSGFIMVLYFFLSIGGIVVLLYNTVQWCNKIWQDTVTEHAAEMRVPIEMKTFIK